MRTVKLSQLLLKAETTFGQENTSGSWQAPKLLLEGNLDVSENLKVEDVVGGQALYYSLIEPKVAMRGWLTTDDLSLLVNLFPTGVISSYTLWGGDSTASHKVLGGVVSSWKLSGKVGEAIQFDVELEGCGIQSATGMTSPSAPTASPIVWHQGVITIGGQNYEVSEFDISVDAKLEWSDMFAAKASNKKRWRSLVAAGQPETKMSLKCYVPSPHSIGADSPSALSVSIAIATLTISTTKAFVNSVKHPVAGGSDLWVQELELTIPVGQLNLAIS